MSEEETNGEVVKEAPKNDLVRRWAVRLGVLLIVFLLGLVPMWWSKRSVANDLDKARRELHRGHLQNSLAAAAVYARRGEYETGRQSASNFFTDLQAELDNTDSAVLTAPEKTQMRSILSGRDEVITLLSRNDPAAADRLSDLYVNYRSITSITQTQ